jgi:hypothetical protein
MEKFPVSVPSFVTLSSPWILRGFKSCEFKDGDRQDVTIARVAVLFLFSALSVRLVAGKTGGTGVTSNHDKEAHWRIRLCFL